MPTNSDMNRDEKRCLAIANKFLAELMTEKTRSSGLKMSGSLGIAASGEMLGEIAADKYRTCMRSANQAASTSSRR